MIILLLALASSISVRSETVLLDFTKSDVSTTSTKWSLTNDPVMGGLSYSTWKPDYDNQEGVWSGSVKIVPSLSAPGKIFKIRFIHTVGRYFIMLLFRSFALFTTSHIIVFLKAFGTGTALLFNINYTTTYNSPTFRLFSY